MDDAENEIDDKPCLAELLGFSVVAASPSCETPIQYQASPEVAREWLDWMSEQHPEIVVIGNDEPA